MIKQFAPYEIATKLNELGFDEECLRYFGVKRYSLSTEYATDIGELLTDSVYRYLCSYMKKDLELVKAPLWQQVIDWFRIKHNIEIHPKKVYLLPVCEEKNIKWIARIDVQESPGSAYADTQYQTYNTYEEARYAGILKALELCQKK